MVVGIIRGLSGIDEKEKKQIQGRIDELTILSKPLFSQIKKADDEVTFNDLIMPYVFSVHAMLDYIQETIHDKAAQEAEINKIVDAFDGAYLWSRVKPYYNNEDNEIKTTAMETETKTGTASDSDSDSAMINMLDDITLLYTQFDLEQLKKPLKRHSKASAETRDRFLALLEQDTLSKAIAIFIIINSIQRNKTTLKHLILKFVKMLSLFPQIMLPHFDISVSSILL